MKNHTDIETFSEWLTRNPDLADNYYPEVMQGLQRMIETMPRHELALIIQKLPEHFDKWRLEAETPIKASRDKKIQTYVNLLKKVIYEYQYKDEITKQAFESVEDELIEQLYYWSKQVNVKPELERMFNKPGDLKKLVKLLTNKGYLENGNVWTKEPVMFAAMAKVCTPLLHESYTEKPTALHRAWTGYFKSGNDKPIVSVQYFKSVKLPELLPHEQKFDWLKFELDLD